MTKQDKFIAYFLIVQAFLGAGLLGLTAHRTPQSLAILATSSAAIVASLVSGIGSLHRKHWAALLGIAVFGVQTPIIITPSFEWYVFLGVHLDLAATWTAEATVGANMVGLVMFLWANVRDAAPNNSFKPKPLRGSA